MDVYYGVMTVSPLAWLVFSQFSLRWANEPRISPWMYQVQNCGGQIPWMKGFYTEIAAYNVFVHNKKKLASAIWSSQNKYNVQRTQSFSADFPRMNEFGTVLICGPGRIRSMLEQWHNQRSHWRWHYSSAESDCQLCSKLCVQSPTEKQSLGE